MKDTNWPEWLPTPNAWASAIALGLLAAGLSAAAQWLFALLGIVIRILPIIPPKFLIVAILLGYLSPIAVVAFAHHYLQGYLDSIFPESRRSEMGENEVAGFFPGLMSWWEGFYGWLTMALSGYLSQAVLVLLFLEQSLPVAPEWLLSQARSRSLSGLSLGIEPTQLAPNQIVYALVWAIVAAYLYLFEYRVRQHLIAAGSQAKSK